MMEHTNWYLNPQCITERANWWNETQHGLVVIWWEWSSLVWWFVGEIVLALAYCYCRCYRCWWCWDEWYGSTNVDWTKRHLNTQLDVQWDIDSDEWRMSDGDRWSLVVVTRLIHSIWTTRAIDARARVSRERVFSGQERDKKVKDGIMVAVMIMVVVVVQLKTTTTTTKGDHSHSYYGSCLENKKRECKLR